MSETNPYAPPDSLPQDLPSHQDPDRLRRIAKAQRQVNVAAALYLGLIPVNILFSVADIQVGLASWIIVLYLLVVLAMGAVSIFRLAAVFRGPVVAVIYVLGLLIPLVGLLLLLSVSGKATRELRSAGIKVGLLGANPKDIQSTV